MDELFDVLHDPGYAVVDDQAVMAIVPSAASDRDHVQLMEGGQLSCAGLDWETVPPWLSEEHGDVVTSLNLSFNNLTSLAGVAGFGLLEELVVDNNALGGNSGGPQGDQHLALPGLPCLRTLSLNNNNITDLAPVLSSAARLPRLTFLSLLGNQACPNGLVQQTATEQDYAQYRLKIIAAFPNLKFLDSTPVTNEERMRALAAPSAAAEPRQQPQQASSQPTQPTPPATSEATEPAASPATAPATAAGGQPQEADVPMRGLLRNKRGGSSRHKKLSALQDEAQFRADQQARRMSLAADRVTQKKAGPRRSSGRVSIDIVAAVPADGLKAVAVPEEKKKELTPEEKKYRARTMIVKEILSTEESYIATVKMIIDLFLVPMRAMADNKRRSSGEDVYQGDPFQIDKGQVKTIFLELETIYSINSVLLQRLQEKVAAWSPTQTISEVFLQIMQFLKAYTTYANNFDMALQTIAALKRDPAFVRFLTHRMTLPECGKLWLDDHMITPIQRIPRYVMLLRDLLKRTAPDHPDHAGLESALDEMGKLATHINEAKKCSEKSVMMIMIQRMVKYCPTLITPTRKFLNDFPCIRMEACRLTNSDSESGAPFSVEPVHDEAVAFRQCQDVVLYLFNDLVLGATHERVSDFFGRTRESFKRLAKGDDVLRPVTADEDGQETLHKYKCQFSLKLNAIVIVDCPEIQRGFAVYTSEGVMYYQSPTDEEKELLLATVREAKAGHEQDLREATGQVVSAESVAVTGDDQVGTDTPSHTDQRAASPASPSDDGWEPVHKAAAQQAVADAVQERLPAAPRSRMTFSEERALREQLENSYF
eukprot:m.184952 g.184952  ORF g.184952 m.184952 type:complete len:824 (-) comp18108_c0_seq7:220-2691(-)